MFKIIGILFSGVVVGYLFRNISLVGHIRKPLTLTIISMLFLLGISIGMNEMIVNNLSTLGWQAVILAVAGTAGSVLASWFCYKLFFKDDIDNEE